MPLRLLDLTLPSPAENLALDEALLLAVEASTAKGSPPSEFLRFWESPVPFVVLGVAGKLQKEVDSTACEKAGVPILRRASGGGTVLQGPGCLNFALVLGLASRPELARTDRSYEAILTQTVDGLAAGEIRQLGTSDLALDDLKFSGNAQKRTRGAVLHHGTVLHDFDLAAAARFLHEPEKRPQYRGERRHVDFLTNVPLEAETIKTRIASAWAAEAKPGFEIPSLEELIAEKYGNPIWTERF